MRKRYLIFFCVILFITVTQSNAHIVLKETFKFEELKDSSYLKGIIINTITNYIDSLRDKCYMMDSKGVCVVRIEDTIPPGNQCYFSLSYIMNRSELYDVQPTHYFLINNKIVFVKCQNFVLGKKIGLEFITTKVKEEALKSLCDDSWAYSYICYSNCYYFFKFTNDTLETKFFYGSDIYFLDWLYRNNVKYFRF